MAKPVLRLSQSGDAAMAVITASGSLDLETAPRLEELVLEALPKATTVIIELSELDLCDSTGLGLLVRMHREAVQRGRAFAVRGPRSHVADVLAMTGIDKVVPVLPS